MSKGWEPGSGVDQKKAEAAERGATKAPEYATKIWKALKGAVGSKATAEEQKAEEQKSESNK